MKAEHKPTKKGYLRFRKINNKLKMEHCIVWEEHYGVIPKGMQIHHIDGNKTNNDISNLQLVTPLEHKRIHSGCIFKNGIWLKPCKKCGEYKEINENNWYFNHKTNWTNSALCKKCYIEKGVNDRRERAARGWKRKNYKKRGEME